MNKTLIVATIAPFFFICVAHAVDPPLLKEGLWSTNMQMTSNPGGSKMEMKGTICRNHAFDEYSRSEYQKRPGCTPISETLAGHTWATETRCLENGSVMDMKVVVTADGDSSAHSESHSTMTPPRNGIAEMTMVGDTKYLGSCPPGVQPGDTTLSNGMVIHGWKH